MRSSSSKRLLGCLALTLLLAASNSPVFAQGGANATSPSDTAGSAPGASPSGDSPYGFKRRARFMQADMQAQGAGADDGTDETARRARMRKAIMRARQMGGAEGPDGAQEPFARNPNANSNLGPNSGPMSPGEGFVGGGFRKRNAFMQDGQFGGRRGFAPRGGGFPGGRKALDLSALNLTEEQKTKIQQMRKNTASRAREVRRKLLTGGQELRDMMFDPAASDEQIRAKGKELRRLHEQAEDMKLDDFLAIRGVLTAEQRKRLPDVKPGGPRAAMAGPSSVRRGDDMPPQPGGENFAPNQ
ncbi:MAG TPA: Spy/CpxP family protein refolding chaperone [Candidatus Melainabacteria bacterium]|nr:Spy/CpxP family protein refolding chaperone [Candidatus Melainabacteria bacterium]